MSDPTPYPYYPDNGQGGYGTSSNSWPNNDIPPYADPTYPNAGSAPYPPPQPNTAYAQGNYEQQPSYPPNRQAMYPPQPAYTPYGGYSTGQTNGPGIAGMVLGIIGVITFWFPFVGLAVSIVGLALSSVGMKRFEGKGFAVAGLVLSIIGVVLAGCITASSIAAFSHLRIY
ncbi:MAG TPA: hypothetical protein VJO32_16625 [Ktedonobacteraceae bacterium]|nr:hypothetical protein [Ktedonobacteraceae bacterium]